MRHDDILGLIGDTPMVGVHALSPNPDVRIFAKLEGQNPGGSSKDRIALRMVDNLLRNAGYDVAMLGSDVPTEALATMMNRRPPNVVCMTDGLEVCTGVAIGAVSRDAQKAKIKVYHISADLNPHATADIDAYLAKQKEAGLDRITVAMHGGGE